MLYECRLFHAAPTRGLFFGLSSFSLAQVVVDLIGLVCIEFVNCRCKVPDKFPKRAPPQAIRLDNVLYPEVMTAEPSHLSCPALAAAN